MDVLRSLTRIQIFGLVKNVQLDKCLKIGVKLANQSQIVTVLDSIKALLPTAIHAKVVSLDG